MMLGDKVNGKIFNVCGDEPHEMQYFTDLLIELSGINIETKINPLFYRKIDIDLTTRKKFGAVVSFVGRPSERRVGLLSSIAGYDLKLIDFCLQHHYWIEMDIPNNPSSIRAFYLNNGNFEMFSQKMSFEDFKDKWLSVQDLDEVEKCDKHHLDYYADEDLFDLSYQHGCYKAYYKRKGAVKSIEKMKKVIKAF